MNEPSPAVAQRRPAPEDLIPAWGWGAYLALDRDWLVIPADLNDPATWTSEIVDRIFGLPRPDSNVHDPHSEAAHRLAERSELARALEHFAATATVEQSILTALRLDEGQPLAALTMSSALLADGITDPDGLVASWGRHPVSVDDPDVSCIDLAAGPAVRRLERLRVHPDHAAKTARGFSDSLDRSPVQELLTYVVFVERNQVLLVEAAWYCLAFGGQLESEVDHLLTTLLVERDPPADLPT